VTFVKQILSQQLIQASGSTMMVSPRDETFDYLANVPLCMIALDERPCGANQQKPVKRTLVPSLSIQPPRFHRWRRIPEHRYPKLRDAVKQARLSSAAASSSCSERSLESASHVLRAGLEISDADAVEGLLSKHFDWTIGVGKDGQSAPLW
jgi:hypothetical protein